MVISGIIRPPPDIRVVVDRTAAYVAKNGRAFEARILKSEKGRTPKFAFLQPSSPFHAYYEDRIKTCENGGEGEHRKDSKSDSIQEEIPAAAEKEMGKVLARNEKKKRASAIDPIAVAVLMHREKFTSDQSEERVSNDRTDGNVRNQPTSGAELVLKPLELVGIVAPSNLSSVQIETIQLVAQFAALDGKGGSFLHQLNVREWSNNQFGFCQPRHPHFAFFSAMVDAYSHIVERCCTGDRVSTQLGTALSRALNEVVYRAERDRSIQNQDADIGDDNRGVDWHDFVVVETIDFPLDEVIELSMLPPPPTTNNDSPYMDTASGVGSNEAEAIRVVPSYIPRVVVPSRIKETRAIDPISGKSVSVADVPEHMRIQLLDPKWAKDKKKFQDNQKESNLVGGDDIAANITRLNSSVAANASSEGTALTLSKTAKDRRPVPGAVVTLGVDEGPRLHQGASISQGHAKSFGFEPEKKRARLSEEGTNRRLQTTTQDTFVHDQSTVYAENTMGGTNSKDSTDASYLHEKVIPRTDQALLSEEMFLAKLVKPDVTLQIRIPNDPTQIAWNFYGQILSMKVDARTTIKDVKSQLSRLHLNGMPPNKIQLRETTVGFLKDGSTLAGLNIGPTGTVEMIPKIRGGRK